MELTDTAITIIRWVLGGTCGFIAMWCFMAAKDKEKQDKDDD